MSTLEADNLKYALQELQGSRDKWKAIGKAIKLLDDDIATIERSHGDDERCLEDVLQLWFKNYPGSSWEKLTELLNASEETRALTRRHRLGPEDIDELRVMLANVAPNWREVARGLGLSREEVENVLSDVRLQSQLDYLEETLSQWLKWSPKNKHPYPHTEELVKALRLEEVGEYSAAEELEKHPTFMSQDRVRGLELQDASNHLKRPKLNTESNSYE